jgi:hypothetical protein
LSDGFADLDLSFATEAANPTPPMPTMCQRVKNDFRLWSFEALQNPQNNRPLDLTFSRFHSGTLYKFARWRLHWEETREGAEFSWSGSYSPRVAAASCAPPQST